MFICKVGCYAEPLYKISAKYLENWQIYPIVKFSDNNINDNDVDTDPCQIIVLGESFSPDTKMLY